MKMKSEKALMALLFTLSLLLFTCFAAQAADLPAGYTAVNAIVAPRGVEGQTLVIRLV